MGGSESRKDNADVISKDEAGGPSEVMNNILDNHDFSLGLESWFANHCTALVVSSATGDNEGMLEKSGGRYAVVSDRKQHWQSLDQNITSKVSTGIVYTVSAIVGISGPCDDSADVIATLRLEYNHSPTRYVFIGRTSVKKGKWANLDGTFTLSSKADRVVFYLEGPPPGIDLLVQCATISCPCPTTPKIENGVCVKDGEDNIILNPNFEDGTNNWTGRNCTIARYESMNDGKVLPQTGKYFAAATQRTRDWNGIQQEITGRAQRKLAYEVTALVRINGTNVSNATIKATLYVQLANSREQYIGIANVQATDKNWVQLQGKFLLNPSPTKVVVYLEGPPAGIDILVNSFVVKHAAKTPPSRSPVIEMESKMCVKDGEDNIILNPNFEDGTNNWTGRNCPIARYESMNDGKVLPQTGKYFAAATQRSQDWNGIQQEITGRAQRKLAYEVTALVRINGTNVSNATVRATLYVQLANSREQYIGIANVQATDKNWVQLQGKFLLNPSPTKVVVYLEGPPAGIDILVNSFVVKHAAKTPPSPPPVIENPNYGVNILQNGNLIDGTNCWNPLGNCTLSVATGSPHIMPSAAIDSLGVHERLNGNYILVTKRTQTWNGPSQMITEKVKLFLTYQVSAWVRVRHGAKVPQNVGVALSVDGQWVNGGQAEIDDELWHEISGSFRIEKEPTKEVMVYVQGPGSGVDLMVAGFQIFAVDRATRFRHLKKQTEKIRKRDVVLKFTGPGASSAIGTYVKVRQIENSFPFGTMISRMNIDNEEFVDFFTKHFNWAVFGNELKWYWTEWQQWNFNYKDADELVELCNAHNIDLRGHCIFWEVADTVQQWVKSLNDSDLMTAVQNRLNGLLARYKGKFKHYDVNNEMLHGSFYQSRLGKDIRANMFKTANQLDPEAILFVNDYHVEDGDDTRSCPEKYIAQILDLQDQGAPVGGIGIQGHIDFPVGPIICSALDKLGILGLPVWFTELDVSSINEHVRADDLEVMLREIFAHPAVEGIVLWGFWELFMSRDNAHLVNAEGDLNEAGKRYLELRKEWMTNAHGHIDSQSCEFEFRGFQGSYEVQINWDRKKINKTFVVDKGESPLVITIDL
ncbi:hypothetical protein QQ045_012892 [Rhodiola kirilowii]